MPASDGLLFVPIAGYFSSRRFLYVFFSQEEVIPVFGLCLWRWDPWGGQISQPRHNLVNSHVVSRVRKVKSHFHSGAFDLAFKIRHHHLPIPLRTNITQSRFSALPRRMVHIRRNAARPGHKLLSPLFYLDISANANSRHPKTSQQSFSLPGWPQNYFNACQNQSDFSGVSFSTQNHIGRYEAPRTTSFVGYNFLSIVMRNWRHGILSSWMVTESIEKPTEILHSRLRYCWSLVSPFHWR